MLIGVDCGCLGIKDKRLKVGVYRLVENLLLSLGKIDKKNSYLLYSFYPIDRSLLSSFGNRMKNVVVSPSRGWMKIWLPLRIRKDKPDVFLALSQAIPESLLFSPTPYTIDFVYDLAFEKFPDMYPGSLTKLQRNSREAAEKSELIITISNSTKRDLRNIYKIKSNKIKVSYPSVSSRILVKGKKYKANKPYFLFVGAMKQTKNVPGLIRGFNYFLKKSNLDYDLYIVGGDKWVDPGIERKNNNIKFFGFVTDKKLSSLYKGAVAFVSPSFYEGFGMSFLEAMKLGCPVIGSNTGSIPEVLGNAGIMVNPKNVKQLEDAMIEISLNSKIRKQMIKRGFKRVGNFSWNNFAADVLTAINKRDE